jgi:hypothetical protein
MSIDRTWERAVAMGRRNREILDLLAQHCMHARDEFAGGHGMAEQATGLPIDMRTIRCAYAKNDVGAAMDLEWIAVSFYRANCVGCPHRRPLGGIPNLASYVVELDAQAALRTEQEAKRVQARARRRHERIQQRAALAAGDTLAVARLFDDLDAVDDGAEDKPEDGHADARRRVVEAARQAPELFSQALVAHLEALAEEPNQAWALEPLRYVARAGGLDPRRVIALAMKLVDAAASTYAAHALADLRAFLTEADWSPSVIRSAVLLGGTPQLHGVGHVGRRGRVRDRALLLVALDVAAHRVMERLLEMLRSSPDRETSGAGSKKIWVPPGVQGGGTATVNEQGVDTTRASAAVAARTVLTRLPDSAGALAPVLLDALDIPDTDDFISPKREVTETLARLLLEQPDVALPLISMAGTSASEDRRRRLFDIVERSAHDLRRYRDRSEAPPSDGTDAEAADEWGDFPNSQLHSIDKDVIGGRLLQFALQRTEGDWGHNTAVDAARLAESVAETFSFRGGGAESAVDTVLGRLLSVASKEMPRPLTMSPYPLAALEEGSRRQARYTVMHALRRTLRDLAATEPTAVLTKVEALLDTEVSRADAAPVAQATGGPPAQRSWEQQAATDLREELIALLGEIARDHAVEPGVLRRVLPRLTSELLGAEPSLRAAAIRAFGDASHGGQNLPSVLSDCLPVLLTDTFYMVIHALLDVVPVLIRQEPGISLENLGLLLQWAYALEPQIRVNRPRWEPDVVDLVRSVASRFEEPVRLQLLMGALGLGQHLDGYDLGNHLRKSWPKLVARTESFARLCVRAFGEPELEDRRDEILRDLVEAWPGVRALSDDEIITLGLSGPTEYPLVGGDFVELLGRLSRPGAAVALAERLLTAIPDVPAMDRARAIATAMVAATRIELLVSDVPPGAERPALREAARRIRDALAGTETAVAAMDEELHRDDPARALFGVGPAPDSASQGMATTVRARVVVLRTLLAIADTPNNGDALRRLTDDCLSAAKALREAFPANIPTAAAYADYAEAVEIVGFFARADAATQDGDAEEAKGQIGGGQRRAGVLAERLAEIGEGLAAQFADPLVTPLVEFAEIAMRATPTELRQLASGLLRLPLPVRVMQAPWHARMPTASRNAREEPAEIPIAVCLLQLDEHPLTEHAQVLHRDQVYNLSVEVRGSSWPEWAERLELEPVSGLSEAELTLPWFAFSRPHGARHGESYRLSGTGALVLRFALAPGQSGTPVRLTGRFVGSEDGAPDAGPRREIVQIAGHPQVRLRPFDPSRDVFTDYQQVDARLLELYARLHGRFPDDQVEAFARFFTAIVLGAERMQFDKTYRKGARISERYFHDDLERRLKEDPTLGGHVTRGARRALGFLDLDHDGVTAELKVERSTPVTEENCAKYLGQPTQYGSGGGTRLSILVVLDMSRKEAPPGTLENDVWLMQPSLHGRVDPAYPSMVGVVVINANNRIPSGWSRRRIDAKRVEPND